MNPDSSGRKVQADNYFLCIWHPCRSLRHSRFDRLCGAHPSTQISSWTGHFKGGNSFISFERNVHASLSTCVLPVRVLIYESGLPPFLSSLCGLLRCGSMGSPALSPSSHPPAQPGVHSFTCFFSFLDLLSPFTHTPACLLLILQLKPWATVGSEVMLVLCWLRNKLSLTHSHTACVLMEYMVCVCMQFWCKKACWRQERLRVVVW